MASAAVIPSSAPAAGAVVAAQPNAAEPTPAAGWLMDERDGFISWLRGEFAAANAIIDLLVVHLRAVGDPGEYDHVFAAVQQRRHHWAPVIHMQQFFPVADVAYALQQSGWRRRAPPAHHPHHNGHGHGGHGPGVSPSPPPPPPRRPGFSPSHSHHRGHGGHHRSDPARGGATFSNAGSDKDGREVHSMEGKGLKEVGNVVDAKSPRLNTPITDEGEKNLALQAIAEGSSKVVPTPAEYATNEITDGKPVNTVEGLKVYEGLVKATEANKILALVNETKASCRRGGFEEVGQTVIVSKRPMKGHGSVIVQLGVPIIDGPIEDENQRETTVEAVPGLLHELFDRLFQQGIVPCKPDYCVIDFFSEGEFCHPQQPPPWYGRPVCTLCLTDCDMVFGRVISGVQGDYKGPLKLSFSAGTLAVLKGRSADVAKRAIPAARKQRILLTFGKSMARKHNPSESSLRFTPPLTPPPMPWGPPSRPTNMRPHAPSANHFGYAPTSCVVPAPAIGPHHIPPSDGIQPLFVAPAPVAAAGIPFQPAVPLPNATAAWMPEAAPRPTPPRVPVPGTGVFLPPGSGHPLPHQMMQASHAHAHTESNSRQDSSSYVHNKGTGMEVANGNASPKSSATAKRTDTTEQNLECNGSSNGSRSFVDEQQNGGMKKNGNGKVEPSASK